MTHVQYCCCCVSVRTGTLILGWLAAVAGALMILSQLSSDHVPAGAYIPGLMGLIAGGMLVFGTYERKSGFFLPFMILSVIWLIVIWIIVLVLVVIGIAIVVFGNADRFKDTPVHDVAKFGAFVEFLIAGLFALFAWLQMHFFGVVRTHYAQLEEDLYRIGSIGV